VNTLADIKTVSKQFGVEIDIRSFGSDLVVTHEPFEMAETLESWLQFYDHAVLIANVKEEGLEEEVHRMMEAAQVANYFFLDQSFPFLMRSLRQGQGLRSAARVSDVESLETLRGLPQQLGWVWLDCFMGDWSFLPQALETSRKYGIKTVIASPELHGRTDETEFNQLLGLVRENFDLVAAVCTKLPDTWNDIK